MNYPTGAEWHRRHSYSQDCIRCGGRTELRGIVKLYVDGMGYRKERIACYLCQRCFMEMLDYLEVRM